jgi:hypothetical protein
MTAPHQPDLESAAASARAAIDRREAIRRVSGLLGGIALSTSAGFLAGCDRRARTVAATTGAGLFTPADIAFLDEVAETILPATGTPGAKAAQCGAFIALMITDSYDEKDRQAFREGMQALDAECRKAHQLDFMTASAAQRQSLLETLDKAQKAAREARGADQAPRHYFERIKELTVVGYFTSEIGCTQALRYAETPGRFDPCVPYTPGERAWAEHA